MTTNPLLPAHSLRIEHQLEFLAGLPSAQPPGLGVARPLPKAPKARPVPARPWLGTDFGYTVVAR